MGRIDAVIPEDLESKLRIEVVKRFGGKKGDLQKAIEQAIEWWVNRPTVEKLKEMATNPNLPAVEKEEAIKILGQHGDETTDILLDIGNDLKASQRERSLAMEQFKEILNKKRLNSSL